MIDVYLFKHAVLDYAIQVASKTLEFPPFADALIIKVLCDIPSYLKYLDSHDDTTPADVSWQVDLVEANLGSAQLFINLIEEMVYTQAFDGTIKNAVRNRKTPEDFIMFPSIQSRFDPINEMRAEERALSMASLDLERQRAAAAAAK